MRRRERRRERRRIVDDDESIGAHAANEGKESRDYGKESCFHV